MGRAAAAVREVVKAYDIRGVVGEQIDEDFAADVGGAFARLIRRDAAAAEGGDGAGGAGHEAVVIGHDMRESSPGLARAFGDGVCAQGLDVVDAGLTSTDQLYYASGALGLPGAMFTASHNPARYNGIKLCRAGARPVGQDSGLDDIAADLVAGVPGHTGPPGSRGERDVLPDYAAFLRSLVDLTGGRRLRVTVDAGNGMGGYTAPAVLGDSMLAPLPVAVDELYFTLDGDFPNHEANPLDPKNLVDLQARVVEAGSDVGLAFDGDADRCFVVDERGRAVPPSAVTALVAERELARSPGATIIHNLITSRAVPELVRELGGEPVRTRVGHSFIKATMAKTDAVFGGEHSAHYYFRDFWNADSGMLAALHVLAALGAQDRPLSELMARYTRYAASGEINSEVDDPAARTEGVVAAFADRAVEVDRLDGVTVDLPGGAWFNLRASNTEPLLRLNAEAPTQAEVDTLTGEVLAVVRGR